MPLKQAQVFAHLVRWQVAHLCDLAHWKLALHQDIDYPQTYWMGHYLQALASTFEKIY